MAGRYKKVIYLLALYACFNGPAFAQQQDPLYRTLSISLGGAYNANRTTFHEYWNPGVGLEASAMMPFYVGSIEAGAQFHNYLNRTPEVPGFYAIGLHTGWSIATPLASYFSLLAGFRVGNYRMTFDYDTFTGVRNESELTLAAMTQLRVHLSRQWFFYVSGTYSKTFTYIRLKPLFISAGIGSSFRTPTWLREIIR